MITLFGVGTASATSIPTVQSRVGSSTITTLTYVGHPIRIGAGQQQGNDFATQNMKLAAGVAARDGVWTVKVTGLTTSYDMDASTYHGSARLLLVRGDAHDSAGADLRGSGGWAGRQAAIQGPARSVLEFGVAAKAGSGRLGTLLQSGERGSLRLPGSGGIDLRGLSTKQAEKFLKQFDTDPHAFKEEFVGRGAISKFDIKMGPGGELHLASKDGSASIHR